MTLSIHELDKTVAQLNAPGKGILAEDSDSKKPRSFVTPFFAAGYGRC